MLDGSELVVVRIVEGLLACCGHRDGSTVEQRHAVDLAVDVRDLDATRIEMARVLKRFVQV